MAASTTETHLIASRTLIVVVLILFTKPLFADLDPFGLWTYHSHSRVIELSQADRVCHETGQYQYRLPGTDEVNYKLLKQLTKAIKLPAPVWVLTGRAGEVAMAIEIFSGQRRQLAAGASISPGVILCRCAVADSEYCSETQNAHYGTAIWIKPTPSGSLPEEAPAEWISRSGEVVFTDLASEAPYLEAQALCRENASDLASMAEIRSAELASQGSDWHRRISDGSCLIWTTDRSTKEPELKWTFRFADKMATMLHRNGIARVICRKALNR
jgi:hypothetical protein